jgi:predicted metal-dependent hydrolase
VIVTLPCRVSRATGLALLTSHASWVSDRLAALPKRITFQDGAEIPIHGETYRVRHLPCSRAFARLDSGELQVSGEVEFLPRRVRDFLAREAKSALVPQAMTLAARVGVQPNRVTLKDTSSRWGSCTASGNLAFSWRLVMAPRYVQHYVVAHEVAHLRQMNHGPEFWKLVGNLSPDAEPAMEWLKREGLQLLRVG